MLEDHKILPIIVPKITGAQLGVITDELFSDESKGKINLTGDFVAKILAFSNIMFIDKILESVSLEEEVGGKKNAMIEILDNIIYHLQCAKIPYQEIEKKK